MTPTDDPRQELGTVRERLERVQADLNSLRLQVAVLEKKLSPGTSKPGQGPSSAAVVPPPLPASVQPPPVPKPSSTTADITGPASGPAVTVEAGLGVATGPSLGPPARPPAIPATAQAESAGGSFELRLGTYWLVRVGVVMLLTALVFFGRYAWQNYVLLLGPGGKLTCMYAVSGMLLAVGAWLPRWRDALRQFGQVLFGGGLAAVYFTTYAAHHLPQLRVIASPLLDGVLLLGWTAIIIALAERRKSELLALFGVGLAFYASAITRVGQFTLYSNVLLSGAAVWFLIRNRWSVLSHAGLIAAYAGYLLWRFYGSEGWAWVSRDEPPWAGLFFLVAYWLVFTVGTFFSSGDSPGAGRRVGFLTLNNAAAFLLSAGTVLRVMPDRLGTVCLAAGGIFAAVSIPAWGRFRSEPWVHRSYLIQGLLLLTLGLVIECVGSTLALMLAVESVLLLTLSTALQHPDLRRAAAVTGFVATVAALDHVAGGNPGSALRVAAVGGLLAFNSTWAGWHRPKTPDLQLRPLSLHFALLASLLWCAATWQGVVPEHRFAWLSLEAAALTLSVHLRRLPEWAVAGQCVLLATVGIWFVRAAEGVWFPHVEALILILVLLGLMHWWPRQRVLELQPTVIRIIEAAAAVSAVGVLWFELARTSLAPDRLAAYAGVAVILTAYGAITRAWWLAAAGQTFTVAFAALLTASLLDGPSRAVEAAAPLAALLVLSASAHAWLEWRPARSRAVREGVLQTARVYRWAALVLFLGWAQAHLADAGRPGFTMALAGLLFGIGAAKNSRESMLAAAVCMACSTADYWLQPDALQWAGGAVAAGLALFQFLARRFPSCWAWPEAAHGTVIVLLSATVWRMTHRWMLLQTEAFGLTASWAVLAFILFLVGFARGERLFRWSGLTLLGLALARVLLVDVWRLDTLYRVISFFALGLVLVSLGFLYNQFQERIRKWL